MNKASGKPKGAATLSSDSDSVPLSGLPDGMGLRERKKLMRLQRIIAAAGKLFTRKGFSNTTIQDIAIEADVGLGTLYLYAKSKEDLLVLVFKEHILKMIDDSYKMISPELPLIDQLMVFFMGHIDYHKVDKELSRTVLKELSFSSTPQRQEDIEQIVKVTYARLGQILERAASLGKTKKTLYLGTSSWSVFALYYHLLQAFLCDLMTEAEFRKNLRNALTLLLE
ncbi:MAG: TetR/AcrR family transcriptional regulator [Pseudomonadales bacterium]|nr:TetR/AcrR family transcriptional regulator [Pseudomonadales bacterium]